MSTDLGPDPSMTRYELGIYLLARLVMGLIYIGLLLWTGAPAWAFVLFLAVTVNWSGRR